MFSQVYNDKRLAGESLLVPFKAYHAEVTQLVSPIKKVSEVFKRAAIIAVMPIVYPFSAVLLGIGMGVKWIDLARRSDELYSKKAMVTSHFPFILEQVSRLGDRIVGYTHAKYLGQEHGLPLYYKPFAGEGMFDLRRKEQEEGSVIHDPAAPLYFKKVVYLRTDEDLKQLDHVNPDESVLYVVPYYPESSIEKGVGYEGIRHEIDWEDPKIKAQNRKLFHVEAEVPMIKLPEDAYTIAVHLRTGGDFDNPDMATIFPTKLPLREFYYQELEAVIRKRIESADTNDKKNIFIHIFTDSSNAKGLKEELERELIGRGLQELLNQKGIQLTLSYKEKASVKEDVAKMSLEFDCLIRPDSNLSGTISKFTNYKLEIYPSHYHINSKWNEIVIDRVEYAERDSAGKKRVSQQPRSYKMSVVKRAYLPTFFYQWMHRRVLGPNYGRDEVPS